MKRSTLLLFLLLLPLTMAPRTSLVPNPRTLDVTIVASRTEVRSGDVVVVAGQVRNVGTTAMADPVAAIAVDVPLRSELEWKVVRSSGCTVDAAVITCPVRPLRPNQVAAFKFSMHLINEGTVTLTAAGFDASQLAPENKVTVTVTN